MKADSLKFNTFSPKGKLRRAALVRAIAAVLALLVLLPPAVRAETAGVFKDPVKQNGEGPSPHYHIDSPAAQGSLPVQRRDIAPGELDCMADARSAVLIDAGTGQLLLSSNPDERLPMASTTKTMTALVVLENCSPDEVVTVPNEAVGVDGSSLYLAYGERLTVRDLLYGLMLRSGNDCAVALAIHVGGSVEGFAAMMNERAQRLGLVNTHFVTPNGLHDAEHYTTAFELALIGAEALKNPVFREIVSTKYYTIDSSIRSITVKNKNSMLWDYEDCIGVKTGYTSQAGRCLLFAAERDGLLLVGCVLNCRPMFDVAPEMLDYGFENYSAVNAVEKGAEVARANVGSGSLPVLAGSTVVIPVKKGEALNLSLSVELDESITAPIMQGAAIGEAIISADGVQLARIPLVAGESVLPRNYRFYFDYLVDSFAP